MKLNKRDLKKISYDFLSLSNRLLQADFRDYGNVLARFSRFIAETDIINDFITDCGKCELDLDDEFRLVQSSRYTFDLGDSDEEEVRNITAIINYIVQNNIDVATNLGLSYSGSKMFQDVLKAFNDRVVLVLIQHIERYLTKVGIDMGLDDKTTFVVTIKNGQLNIANDNAVINANSSIIKYNLEQLENLVKVVTDEAEKSNLSYEDYEQLKDSLDIIKEQTNSDKPKKGYIKTAIAGLKGIKGTAEFTAAVTALIQFFAAL